MAYSEWSREDGWSKRDTTKRVVAVGDGEEDDESGREKIPDVIPPDDWPEIDSGEDLQITPVTPDLDINKDREAVIRDAIIKGGLLDKSLPVVNDQKDEIN